jgi:hypothetical protein
MLNAALVQKQQLINSLRRELFQCRNTIDALNEEKRDLIMQKQHSLVNEKTLFSFLVKFSFLF